MQSRVLRSHPGRRIIVDLIWLPAGQVKRGKEALECLFASKWSGLQEAELCVAAQEVAAGQVEAALGGNVCKKRVALPGEEVKQDE